MSVMMEKGNKQPMFPIFIPTKNRYKTPYTIRALRRIGVPFIAVVEKPEYEAYKRVVGNNRILVLPTVNKGLTVTRNWIWDYAQFEMKTPFFWTMDDNLEHFYRLHKNKKHLMTSGAFIRAVEDFSLRYDNLAISGMQYDKFAVKYAKNVPFRINKRVYSNMLIRTDIPFRNEGRWNEDTDLNIRVLKAGWCTMLINAFLVGKKTTMTAKGGMTDFYDTTDNRREFAEELARRHPDCVKVVYKFHRWHHEVDYSKFKHNKLIKKDADATYEPNNYGLALRRIKTNEKIRNAIDSTCRH